MTAHVHICVLRICTYVCDVYDVSCKFVCMDVACMIWRA
jgi:hypothetical protein